MLKGLYILNDFNLIYGSVHEEIGKYIDFYTEPQTKQSILQTPSILSEAEVIFSGWGCPLLDEKLLQYAPKLQAVFYGSGSVKGFVTDAFWEKNITLSSAYAANGLSVAEYTLSQILFSLKRGWSFVNYVKRNHKHLRKRDAHGVYGSTIGIISLGMIGRMVCEFLKHFDVRVIAYDPYVSQEDASKLQVELCSLEQIFQLGDVVSLHAPNLKETEGLITGSHFASMKHNATFINTARGHVVREHEMIEVLQQRQDIFALLDVTYPEPPVEGSPLYHLDNVILTPHIAGAMNRECQRMGKYMLDELLRYLNGEELHWGITREKVVNMA
ncbi:Phosphoglycerate dehydrogenase [Paenibacillus sp. UNCCL117]|uniref:hydroxyacid dehydrogenase n=1 Tax=unclassified Paenibacillus TaxID=185978 RepID=UPI00088BD797|nr:MULTISPECIES: hydroxyacid dehydrogenase [unclassified Paenibacillus]SDE11650.1 Phosphoglycerate dehydrogenase [Paenibacillus sp. cl123]SFW60026.1 Phosphoglycerate dehydrogenase [Paenibacillus sp. UNCCL117]